MTRKRKNISALGSMRVVRDEEDLEKDRAREAKMRQINRNIFASMPIPGFTQKDGMDLRVGDVIASRDHYNLRYIYGIVTQIKDDGFSCSPCDKFGNKYWSDSNNAQAFSKYDSERLWVKDVDESKVKHKKIGEENIIHENGDGNWNHIVIFDKTDSELRPVSASANFVMDSCCYYLVASASEAGFIKEKRMFPTPNSDSEHVEEMVCSTYDLKKIMSYKGLIFNPGYGATECAKNIRTVLKQAFPDIKFKVTSSNTLYGSVDIEYTDGVAAKKVRSVLSPFRMVWDGDTYSDYYSYAHTSVTRLVGGVSSIDVRRELSLDVKKRVKKIVPEFNTRDWLQWGEMSDYHAKIQALEKEFNFKVSEHGDNITTSNNRLTIDSILKDVDLDVVQEQKKKRIQLTPTEKKVRDAVGSGNIILKNEKGMWDVYKKPTVESPYFYPVYYSQDSVRKKMKQRYLDAGLELDKNGYISNYPEILQQIEKERKELNIEKTYSKISYSMLLVHNYKLSNINSHMKWEIDEKENRRRW